MTPTGYSPGSTQEPPPLGAEDASGARPTKRQFICEMQNFSLSSLQVTLLKVVTKSAGESGKINAK